MGKTRVAEKIQQHAVAVGQHDGVAGPGQLLVQVGHLAFGHCAQVGQVVLAFLQLGMADHFRVDTAVGVEPVIVQAPDP
jgi:hypothetical protein